MKQNLLKKIEILLDRANLRKTQPRIDILMVLFPAKHPLTPQMIAKRLRKKSPDKVTVYRVLKVFVKANIVHRVYLQDRASHYGLSHNCSDKQCHPHFTCTGCGVTTCILDADIPLISKLGKGYIVHRQQVKFQGLCPKCT